MRSNVSVSWALELEATDGSGLPHSKMTNIEKSESFCFPEKAVVVLAGSVHLVYTAGFKRYSSVGDNSINCLSCINDKRYAEGLFFEIIFLNSELQPIADKISRAFQVARKNPYEVKILLEGGALSVSLKPCNIINKDWLLDVIFVYSDGTWRIETFMHTLILGDDGEPMHSRLGCVATMAQLLQNFLHANGRIYFYVSAKQQQ